MSTTSDPPAAAASDQPPAHSAVQPHQQATTAVAPPTKLHHSFVDSFWSSDYASGLNVLFDKLEQGVAENAQILDFVSRRISLESAYAANMKTASESVMSSRTSAQGFDRDEGASVKQVFVAFLDESSTQGELHARIAANLERHVRGPFTNYAAAHKQRITDARNTVMLKMKAFTKSAANAHKSQQTYYAKARQLEELTNSSIPIPAVATTSSKTFSSAISSSASALNKRLSISLSRPSASTLDTQATIPEETSSVVTTPTSATAPTPIAEQLTSNTEPTPNAITIHRQSTLDLTVIGGQPYSPVELGVLLDDCLSSIPQETFKIPILGSYPNVSTGEAILQYIRTTIGLLNIGFAEKFGQDLIDHGFLRLVGAVGNRFSGTSNSRYQWLPKALQYSKNIAHQQSLTENSGTESETFQATEDAGAATFAKRTTNMVSGYFSSLLASEEDDSDAATVSNDDKPAHKRHESMSILSSISRSSTLGGNGHSRTASFIDGAPAPGQLPRRESQISKLQREITELDEKYQATIESLDQERCALEQTIFEFLPHLQQCERDRLKAVKTVLADFTTGAGRTVNNFYQSVQRMSMHHSLLDPMKDLDYLIERYKTGPFAPKPVVYMGFFKSRRIQSFGVDLKFVPFVIEDFISYIADEHNVTGKIEEGRSNDITEFPTLSTGGNTYKSKLTSAAARDILVAQWSEPQSAIAEIQALRRAINTAQKFDAGKEFKGYTIPIVISTLREFLLELPDSIVSSTVYDIIKSTYAKSGPGANVSPQMTEEDKQETERINSRNRIERLVGLLTHLERGNLSNLKILVSHFADITGVLNKNLKEDEQDATVDVILEADVPESIKEISRSISPYLLRPRTVTALTLADKHPTQLTQDLILYRDAIFSQVEARLEEAKKNRRRSRSASGSEANRRFHIEERNKAIAAAAAVNGGSLSSSGYSSLTPSHSSTSLAATLAASGTAASPPRNGPLPLTLSSGVRSKHNSSDSDEFYDAAPTQGDTASATSEGSSSSAPLSSLHPGRPSAAHRRSPSGTKLSIRSFLEPGGGISRSSTPQPTGTATGGPGAADDAPTAVPPTISVTDTTGDETS